jgi:hypothetical protein
MPVVRLAARDPGAANVLAPLLAAAPPGWEWDVWALPRAGASLRSFGFGAREFADGTPGALLEFAWKDHPAAVLVTGTSHYAPFESLLWQMARRERCPSLALLDAWANLETRFRDARPDAIGVLDSEQRDAAIALGFPAQNVLEIGQLWLSWLRSDPTRLPPPAAATARGVKVLFASEPIAADVRSGAQPSFGFDETDALALLHRAAAASRAEVTIAVKPHPYEAASDIEASLARLPPAIGVSLRLVPHSESSLAWARWADLVAGVANMVMLEAMAIGKPVVSVQPGLCRENCFAPGRMGDALTLVDPLEGEVTLARVLSDAAFRSRLLDRQRGFFERCTVNGRERVLEWIGQRI